MCSWRVQIIVFYSYISSWHKIEYVKWNETCIEHWQWRSNGHRLQSSHLKEKHITLTALRMLRRYFRREFSSRNSSSCEEVKSCCCGSLSLSISSWSNLISLSYMAYWKQKISGRQGTKITQPSDSTHLSYKKYSKVQADWGSTNETRDVTNIVWYSTHFYFSFTLTGYFVAFCSK